MIRYYWTFFVAFLLLVFIGVPAIAIGHILRRFFGVEDFIFPPAKFGCRGYVWAAGARVHVSGLERLDRDQAYVFVANHQSNLDPPMLLLPRPQRRRHREDRAVPHSDNEAGVPSRARRAD
jgi:1-acyl-sn-glycerol-3-phosphate acyltransferase